MLIITTQWCIKAEISHLFQLSSAFTISKSKVNISNLVSIFPFTSSPSVTYNIHCHFFGWIYFTENKIVSYLPFCLHPGHRLKAVSLFISCIIDGYTTIFFLLIFKTYCWKFRLLFPPLSCKKLRRGGTHSFVFPLCNLKNNYF